jgi:ferredoxin
VSEAWRVTVDRELCQNHGQCVYSAPQVFAFDDEEELVYDPAPDAAQQASVQQAVAACPVRAISLHHPSTP